jgi:hypothetical protein
MTKNIFWHPAISVVVAMVATRLECSKYGNPHRPAWLGLRVAVRMKIYRIVVVLVVVLV